MNLFLDISIPSRRVFIKPATLIVTGYVIIGAMALRKYLDPSSISFLLGLFAWGFIMLGSSRGERSNRFGWVACIFLLLGFLLPVKTFLFFAIGAAIIFLKESRYGRVGLLPLMALALMSPAFQYLADAFSFPVRLQLTQIAGTIFNKVGIATVVKGNLILQSGKEFSVDPGCMGLNMMQASFLLGIMLIVVAERQYKKKIGFVSLLFYFLLVVILNIIANLFRILILVQFNILPGTVMHDVTGLGCLLLYVFLPAIYLSGFIAKGSSHSPAAINNESRFTKKYILVHSLLFAAIAALAIYVMKADTYKKINLAAAGQVGQYSATLYAPGIVKLQDAEALIYIKYIRGFYDTDHNPMICWKGSGYTFEQVQQQTINGGKIYSGELTSGNDKLFSAWWYTNGETITTDQWKWRWKMIGAKRPQAVVNVTCSSREELQQRIETITQQKILSPFFTDKIFE